MTGENTQLLLRAACYASPIVMSLLSTLAHSIQEPS